MKTIISVFIATTIVIGAYGQNDSGRNNVNPGSIDFLAPGNTMDQNQYDYNKHNQETSSIYSQDLNKTNSDKQNDAINNLNSESNSSVLYDCLIRKNGKMLIRENGIITEMDPDMVLNNGTRVMIDGSIYERSGRTSKMKNGQQMDMSGKLRPVQSVKQIKKTTSNSSKAIKNAILKSDSHEKNNGTE